MTYENFEGKGYVEEVSRTLSSLNWTTYNEVSRVMNEVPSRETSMVEPLEEKSRPEVQRGRSMSSNRGFGALLESSNAAAAIRTPGNSLPKIPKPLQSKDKGTFKPMIRGRGESIPPPSHNKENIPSHGSNIRLEESSPKTLLTDRLTEPSVLNRSGTEEELSHRLRFAEIKAMESARESTRLRQDLEVKEKNFYTSRMILEKRLVEAEIRMNELEDTNAQLERNNRELQHQTMLSSERGGRELEMLGEIVNLKQAVAEKMQELAQQEFKNAQLEALLKEKTAELKRERDQGGDVDSKELRERASKAEERASEYETRARQLEKEVEKLQLQFLTLTRKDDANVAGKSLLEEKINECKSLSAANVRLTAEVEGLRNETRCLHVENGVLAKEIAKLKEKVEGQNKRILEQTILATSMNNESILSGLSRSDRNDKYVQELKATIQTLEQQRDESFRRESELIEERNDLSMRVKELEVDLEASLRRTDALIDSKGTEISCLVEDNRSLKRMLSLLEKNVQEKDSITSSLNLKLQELQQKLVNDANNINADYEAMKYELERQKSKHEKQVQHLTKQIEAKDERIQEFDLELEEFKQKLEESYAARAGKVEEAHRVEVESMQAEIARLKENVTRLEEAQRQTTRRQENNPRLEEEVLFLRKQALDTQTALNECRIRAMELDETLVKKEEELLKRITMMKNFEGELLKGRRDYQACVEEKENLRQKMRLIEDESRTLEQRLRKVESELVKSKQRVNEIVNLLGDSRYNDVLEKVNKILCN
eukprot:TRINITY_DN2659_c0_g1_i5.p1 TRINITY_DN2659_c0_g1~~TRINITY_DN2659_c0_g1_i5.p1  ORF type:complete len:773 (-),score=250.78 TRINITY_DN2659_c0_g1_i5:51-2369(-)